MTPDELDSWLDQVRRFGYKSGFECGFAIGEIHKGMSKLRLRIKGLEKAIAYLEAPESEDGDGQ